MIKLSINNLKLQADVGAYDHEKGVKQPIIVNVEYEFDDDKALREDELNNTVDYHPLTKQIIELVDGKRFNLIEYLAGLILDLTINYDERIKRAIVRIDKPEAIDVADSTAVEISKSR